MQLSRKIKLTSVSHGKSILCVEAIRPGERLFRLTGSKVTQPTKYTIQRAGDDHVLADPGAEWMFVNHSCEPNTRIDFGTWELVARREIAAGEEISFDYHSTEWELATPFTCHCGEARCVGTIRGFRFLDEAQREALQPLLSPWLAAQQRELTAAPAR